MSTPAHERISLRAHDSMDSLNLAAPPQAWSLTEPKTLPMFAQPNPLELYHVDTVSGAVRTQLSVPLAADGTCYPGASPPMTINGPTSLYGVCQAHNGSRPQVTFVPWVTAKVYHGVLGEHDGNILVCGRAVTRYVMQDAHTSVLWHVSAWCCSALALQLMQITLQPAGRRLSGCRPGL